MVPGGLVDPFLPALADFPQLKPIVAAQEGGAAYMADGYARASGNFGAALCIGGPGLGNMTTALAAALTDGSRVLVVSGEVATAMEGLGAFQDASAETLDDPALVRPVTRFSVSVDNAANLNHMFRRAMSEMLGPPAGPVHLSLPRDVITGEVGADHDPIDRELFRAGELDRGRSELALAVISGKGRADAPLRIAFLAGAGVEHADAAATLKEVAERFSIPVATTLRAKGVFPEDHPLSLGVFGYAGTRHATARAPLRGPRSPDRARLGSQRTRHDALERAACAARRHHRREHLDPGPDRDDARRSRHSRRCRSVSRRFSTRPARRPSTPGSRRARNGSRRSARGRGSTIPKTS